MVSERGREIHGKAEHAREAGNFVLSLQLSDEATVVYEADGDVQGLSEVQGSRLLAFRHLYEQTGNTDFLILAKHAAQSGVEIVEKHQTGEALSMPYFNLAKAYEALGELQSAITYYEQAINSKQQFPGQFHNRVGVVADMKGHLFIAQFKNGDTSGLAKAQEAMKELQESDEPKYNNDVWLSGAHMRIAEAIYPSDKDEARKHIDLASQIIDANKELVLRREQILKLREKLSV